jgi:dimethylaniline monooxygenase (N-oxide forming)
MLPFCNSLATDLGIVPTFGRLLYRVFTSSPFTAFSILKYFYFGMITSAPYRLFGHGAKPEIATATILRMAKEEKSLSKAEKDALAADLLRRANGKVEN